MKVDEELVAAVKTNPEDTFQLIVRVEGDLDTRQGQLEAEGFVIARRLRLISGFAGSAKGANVEKVMVEEWILSIERDEPVHTMGEAN